MSDIAIRTTDAATVAYCDVHGSFDRIPEVLGRLYGWVGQHGLRPEGMPSCVYFNVPDERRVEDAVWEARARLSPDSPEVEPDDSGIGVKVVEPTQVAALLYRGPYEAVASAYQELMGWVADQGYRIAGPPEEVYLSDPATTAPTDYLTEIRIPVTL